MWQDFFYFSKSERRAVVVLVVLIAAVELLSAVYSDTFVSKIEVTDKTDAEIEEFIAHLDSVKRKRYKKYKKRKYPPRPKLPEVVLASFDPNKADSVCLLTVGLKPWQAHNVLQYRRRGGKFHNPEAFSRIYGLDSTLFATLEPYIIIGEEFQRKPRLRRDTLRRDTFPRQEKFPDGTIIDINTADTTMLKKIPGIGSVTASRIVRRRRQLGGFTDTSQLSEVKHFKPEMKKWFKIGRDSIRTIKINRAHLDELCRHPYMNFYRAKVIMEHRRKRGPIKSIRELSLYEEFPEEVLIRLEPYLCFE